MRSELKKGFKDLRGVDFGMTVGVYAHEGVDVEWFDLALMRWKWLTGGIGGA